ncbi:MAG: hypothetical protein M1824_003025 [Vezdaea acicularis]|nr:MAG: hypothetical protein M1824_003025 [Vezdaea acicularis]
MSAPWLNAFPRTTLPFLQETDSLLSYPLSDLIASGPNSALSATGNAQPAIMAISILILRILEQEFGFRTSERVDVTLGHSLGEFAALVAAGNMSYPDSLLLVRKRALAMADCSRTAHDKAAGTDEYGMFALMVEPAHLSSLIAAIEAFLTLTPGRDDDAEQAVTGLSAHVSLANVNAKNQIVLSGSVKRVKELLEHLRSFGGHDPRAVRLSADAPFHSPLMRPAGEMMRGWLADGVVVDEDDGGGGGGVSTGTKRRDIITFPGHLPVISNVSARPFSSASELKDLLARQAVETVRWWDSIRYLDQEFGVRRWIGLGPGKVGRNLVGKEVGMRGADGLRGGGVWGLDHPREVEGVLRGLEETEGWGDDEGEG